MSTETSVVIVACIAAIPPTLAVLWHKRSTAQNALKLDEIITLVNGRLAKMLGGVESRLRAVESEMRRLIK